MTGIRSNNQGQMTLDFLLGLTIFLIALIYLVAAIPGIFLPYQNNAVDLSSVAYRTSSLLVEDPGYYIPSGSYIGFTGWEKSQQNINNLSRIGLASSKSTPGVISLRKINALQDSVSYRDSRDDLGLNNTVPYDYSLSITWTNKSGHVETMTKPNATEPKAPVGSNVETIERAVLIDEGSSILINGAEYYNNTSDNLDGKLSFNLTKDQALSGDVYINIINAENSGHILGVWLYNSTFPLTRGSEYDVYVNGTKWEEMGNPAVGKGGDINITINGPSIASIMGPTSNEVDIWVWTDMPIFRVKLNDHHYRYDDSNPRYWSVYDKGTLSLKVWS